MSFEIDKKILDKFWLGYLNSKFTSWYAYNFVYARAIRGMDFYNFYIQQLPIPDISLDEQNVFVELVDKILLNNDKDTSKWELEINIRIYHLYNLTYQEVKIIDPEFSLSKQEYSDFKI